MNKYLPVLLPLVALLAAAAIVLTGAPAESPKDRGIEQKSADANAPANKHNITVASVADGDLEEVVSVMTLARRTPTPDLIGLAAARKSLLVNSELQTRLAKLVGELQQLKGKLSEVSQLESSAREQLSAAQIQANVAKEQKVNSEEKIKAETKVLKGKKMALDQLVSGEASTFKNLELAKTRRIAIRTENGTKAAVQTIIEQNEEMLDREEFIVYHRGNPIEHRPLTKDKRREVETALRRARETKAEWDTLDKKIELWESKLSDVPKAERLSIEIRQSQSEIDAWKKRGAAAQQALIKATDESQELQTTIDRAAITKERLSSQIKDREEAINNLKAMAAGPPKPTAK